MDLTKLKPGDDHYIAYVGPPTQYDFMGATQFRLLCTLGLRAKSKFLDFGCGSLRAGRLFIPYLNKGNYFGIEPNKWLINDAKKNDLGEDLFRLKLPSFDYNMNFECDMFNTKFNFIVAQSIFSHTGVALIEKTLQNFYAVLEDDGLIVATFIHGEKNYERDDWVYPACVVYTEERISKFIEDANLFGCPIPWYHPRQSWYVLAKKQELLPNENMKKYLLGAVLNDEVFRESVIE